MKPKLPRYGAFLLAVPFWCMGGLAYSQTIYDWKDTAPDGNWTQGAAGARWWDNTNSNDLWDIPPSGGILRFNNNAWLTMTNNATGYSGNGIVFGSSNTSVRTLGGNAIRFYDYSGADPYIQNLSSATHVFNLNIEGDGDAGDPLNINLDSTGGLTFNGTIDNKGSAVNVGGVTTSAAIVALNGVVSGTGDLYKSNANTILLLAAANTYTGGTTIAAGTVRAANNSAFGTGPVSVTGSSTLASSGGARTLGNAITIASGATATLNGSAGLLTLNGGISGSSGNLVVSGGGSVALGGTSSVGSLSYGGSTATSLSITSGSLSIVGNLALGSGIAGHSFAVSAGASVNAATITNSWQTSYTIDGTLSSNGNWSISTNATSTIAGASGGVMSAGSLTLGNVSTKVNYSASGTMNIAGSITVASNSGTGTPEFNQSAGVVNAVGILLGDNTANTSGSRTFTLTGGRLNLGSGGIASTGTTTATKVVNFGNAIVGASANWSSSLAITLNGTGSGTTINTLDSVDGATARTVTLSGILSGSGNLVKAAAGTLTLSGANTFTGAASVTGGTLSLSGANGVISSSSGISVSGGGILKLDNTSTANNTNRLSDAGTVNMGGGTLNFSNNAGAVNYSETTGALTISGGSNAILASQAASGQTSTLTFASLARTGGSVDFSGTNLGVDTTNRIVFTTAPTLTSGIIGGWATYGGTNWATYDATLGVKAYTGYTDYTRLSSGTKVIANDGTANVRIIEGTGSAASLTLAAATTGINTLNQTATGGAVTIDMGTNTLRLGTAGGILAGSGTGALTIGASANQGFLSAGGSTANTAGSLTVTNNSANALTINSPLINNGTGVIGLVKSGSGTVALNGYTGATYSGGTLVGQGELRVVAPTTAATYATLGTGAVTVNPGATLRFYTGSTTNTITYTNAINLYNATLAHEDGTHVLTGNVALTGTNTITGRWVGKNLTMSGVISGTGNLVKTNTAGNATTLLLSGANTYTGTTTVDAGTLRLGNASALGTTAGGTTVSSGAVLDLNGQTIGAEPLSLSGTGISSGGALINSSATAASISGPVALLANSSIGATGNITLGGAISGAFSLTKVGAGTLTLPGANTYTGATSVTAGRLTLTGTNASSITMAGGTTLTSSGSTTGALTMGASSTVALNGLSPSSAFSASGAVTVSGSTAIVFDAVPTAIGTTAHTVFGYGTLSGLANLTAPVGYRGAGITDDTVNKKVLLTVTTGIRTWNMTAPGTWNILTDASWLEGDTLFGNGDTVVFDDTASNGVVTLSGTLQPASVTFNNSATSYNLGGSGVIGGTGNLVKNGTGTVTIATANTFTGGVTISGGRLITTAANNLGAGTSRINLSGGGVLEADATYTLGRLITVGAGGGTVEVAAGATLTHGGAFNGGNTLTKEGAGTLNFSGYAGSSFGGSSLVINNGIARFGTSAFNANLNLSAITVNSGGILVSPSGTPHSLGGYFAATPAITVNAGGTYQVGQEQYLNTINLAGGSVLAEAGGNNPEIRTDSNFQINASGSSVWTARMSYVLQDFRIVTAAGADFTVSGVIRDGGKLLKSGDGLLSVSGANTYTGVTTVSAGVLRVANSAGLGSTSAGATVASGAALELSGDIAVGAEALTLNGTGVSSGGALRNQAGTNSYGGAITLASDSRINADSGTALSLSGAVSNGGFGLTVGGAGNTAATGVISGTGALSKDGAGTLTLSGNNTYTGTTTVNAGKLVIDGDQTAATGALTVKNGAILGGSGTIGGDVLVESGGTHAPGNSPGIQTVKGGLNYASGSIFEWDLASSAQGTRGTGYDGVNVAGSLTGSGAIFRVVLDSGAFSDTFWNTNHSWTNIFLNNGTQQPLSYESVFGTTVQWYAGATNKTGLTTGYFTISGSTLNWTAVPELSNLLAGGLLGAGLLRRRRCAR